MEINYLIIVRKILLSERAVALFSANKVFTIIEKDCTIPKCRISALNSLSLRMFSYRHKELNCQVHNFILFYLSS